MKLDLEERYLGRVEQRRHLPKPLPSARTNTKISGGGAACLVLEVDNAPEEGGEPGGRVSARLILAAQDWVRDREQTHKRVLLLSPPRRA